MGRDGGQTTKRSIDSSLPAEHRGGRVTGDQAVGDFDGDSYDDLVLCDGGPLQEGSESLRVLFGAADGWSDIVEMARPIRGLCPGLAAGDSDGDGRDDLFVAGGFELGLATGERTRDCPARGNSR